MEVIAIGSDGWASWFELMATGVVPFGFPSHMAVTEHALQVQLREEMLEDYKRMM